MNLLTLDQQRSMLATYTAATPIVYVLSVNVEVQLYWLYSVNIVFIYFYFFFNFTLRYLDLFLIETYCLLQELLKIVYVDPTLSTLCNVDYNPGKL